MGRSIGVRAIDVGCGLGDNAEALAAAGANVTAFDLVERAVIGRSAAFPRARSTIASPICSLCRANGAPPSISCMNVTLCRRCPTALLARAARSLASLVAPGGRLLVIARARDDGQKIAGPPWPLTRSRIEALAVDGLRLETLEDIPADRRSRPALARGVIVARP